ncbi:uncharacterized protein LOC117291638, partial [Asterias rubens]|uniref:uncharacterized protein LOC117291638 n=1 Tax=Asterias rubens TaxID=7604 RepID=UPI001454FC78
RDSANSGSRAAPKSHRVGPAPFRSPPRDAFFSIEGSRLERDNQGQSRPNSRLYEDPLHDYFPSISLDHEFDVGVSSRSHSRSESVPIPNADSFEASDADVTTRSTTAPPNVDLSLKLSDLANLDMSANDITTVGIEKEQEKFKATRRLTISSAMGARQHGSPRPASLGGARRKRLEREHAYLRMKFRERPCLRTESFLNQDLADEVNDMSRECCDVLGPKACHECDRLNRRSNSALRNEANFPSLHISAANFSTMTMVTQVRPDLSSREVLERLAQGDITRPQSLRHRKGTSKTGNNEEDDEKSTERKISISAFSVPDGQGYFTNFTDLREQIFARQGKTRSREKRFNGAQNMSNLPVITNVEIVPKKEHERENPANYFGPPMMSREEIKRQQSQPRFYAGAQGKYELPEAPSIDEIVRQATGARHQKLREPEPRSDTPDSDISFRSQKSPMPEENLSVDQGKINERKSNLDVNANEETNVLE